MLAILLDFSKAFDKVPHRHIIKLQYYRIREKHLIGYPHFYLIVLNNLGCYVVVLPQTIIMHVDNLAVFPKALCWGLYFF